MGRSGGCFRFVRCGLHDALVNYRHSVGQCRGLFPSRDTQHAVQVESEYSQQAHATRKADPSNPPVNKLLCAVDRVLCGDNAWPQGLKEKISIRGRGQLR